VYERAAWTPGASATIEVVIPTLTTGKHTVALHYGNASLASTSAPVATTTTTPRTVLNDDQLPVSNLLGGLGGKWVVRTTDTRNVPSTLVQKASEASANTDAPQTIAPTTCGGDIDGCSLTVTGGDTSGTAATTSNTYAAFDDTAFGSPMCSTFDAARDTVYKITPTANTTLEIKLRDPNFASAVAIFDGGPSPRSRRIR
jgi:hypothetical protein